MRGCCGYFWGGEFIRSEEIEKEARRSAAEEMRERAAKVAEEDPLTSAVFLAQRIRALPIEE